MNSTVRTILFWLVMIVLAVVLWHMASSGGQTAHEDEPSYTTFLAQIQSGNLKEVTIALSQNSAEISGVYRENGTKFRNVTVANSSIPDITKALQDKGVLINIKEVKNNDWIAFVVNFAPAHTHRRLLDFHDEADAGGREQGAELREIARAFADRAAERRRRSKMSLELTKPRKNSTRLLIS